MIILKIAPVLIMVYKMKIFRKISKNLEKNTYPLINKLLINEQGEKKS